MGDTGQERLDEMPRLSNEQRDMLTAPDARMDAYYYGFERTGCPHVDAVLSAVAWAGKASHSTEQWYDDQQDRSYGPFVPGEPYTETMQRAANEAAQAHAALLARLRTVEAERDAALIVINAIRREVDKPLTWAQSLSRDFNGNPFPRILDRQIIENALSLSVPVVEDSGDSA